MSCDTVLIWIYVHVMLHLMKMVLNFREPAMASMILWIRGVLQQYRLQSTLPNSPSPNAMNLMKMVRYGRVPETYPQLARKNILRD